jgi:LacI family transcriptional regulator
MPEKIVRFNKLAKPPSTTAKSLHGRPTIRDVARLAGVGVGSVSRVVNNHAGVKPKTREAIERIIAEIGFEPDSIAGSMRRITTHTVGCVIRDFNLPGFAEFINAAEAVFRAAGYTMLLANTDGRKDSEMSLLKVLSQRRTDGVLMTLSDETDQELIDTLNRLKMKVVLINRDVASTHDRLLIDHQSGMIQATKYLCSLGHRRIALLTSEVKIYPGRNRIAGFTAALEEMGRSLARNPVRTGVTTSDSAFLETAALLSGKNPPTAIIVGGRALLSGTIRAIRNIGLKVGPDVSLITDSDSELAELMTPSITAVRWDLEDWGRTAARMLLERLKQSPVAEPRRIVIATELVVRDSCMPVRSMRARA